MSSSILEPFQEDKTFEQEIIREELSLALTSVQWKFRERSNQGRLGRDGNNTNSGLNVSKQHKRSHLTMRKVHLMMYHVHHEKNKNPGKARSLQKTLEDWPH